MINRPVATGAHKLRVSAGIRQLARHVTETFPEMKLEGHLHDAARELDAGRTHSAQRHLNAVMFGLQPQQVRRHGVHDDGGHEMAKALMQQAYRHLLNVKDIEDMSTSNEDLVQRRRDAVAQAQAARQQAVPAGKAPVPVPVPAGSQLAVVLDAIELAAGQPHRYKHGWVKLLDAGAAVPPEGGEGVPLEARRLPPKQKKVYASLRAKGHSHGKAMAALGRMGKLLNAGAATEAATNFSNAAELATFAGKPPGSGANFKKLSATLAKRGARNPGALAAYIGRKKYGRKGFAKLSAHSHANPAGGIGLAFDPSQPRDKYGMWMRVAGHIRQYQEAAKNGDHQGALSALRDAENAAEGPMKESLGRAVQAHASGDTYTAGLHVRKAEGMMGGEPPKRLALANGRQQVIELRYNPRQPRDTHGRWSSIHASYHAQEGVRRPGHGAQHGNFGAAYEPGSLDHIRAIWDLGTEAGSRSENRSPTMRNALHNMARAVTRRDIRSARGHLAEARAANLREAQGFYTNDLDAIDDQLSRVPKTAGDWMKQANPLSYAGQHIGRYADRVGGQLPFNPTEGAYPRGARERLTAARMSGTSEMSWSGVLGAIELSAKTAMLERTPAPYGKPGGPGLYGKSGNKHSDYFEQVVKALMTKRGMDKAHASAVAWSALRKWRLKSKHAEVKGAATRALGEEARAAGHAADQAQWMREYILTGTAAGAAKDPRTPLGTFGSGGAAPKGDKARQRQQLMAKIKLERQRITQLHKLIHALQVSEQASARKRQQATKAGATGKTQSSTPAKRQQAQTTSSSTGPASAAPSAGTRPGAKRLSRPKQIAAYQEQITKLTAAIRAQQKQLAGLK
jgi:hypothetical protein